MEVFTKLISSNLFVVGLTLNIVGRLKQEGKESVNISKYAEV